MTFVSSNFLVFVAVTTCAYFALPARVRWTVLLVASYVFLYLNSGRLLLVHLAATAITYAVALRIQAVSERMRCEAPGGTGSPAQRKRLRAEAKRATKPLLVFGVCADLFMLAFLKYHNFFARGANQLLGPLGVAVPLHSFLMPLGISFYTLQAISYLVDVYRGKCAADRSFPRFALFMSFFPQIVQGPIARYDQLAHQLYEPHEFDYTRLCHGLQLVLWGWLQKLVIAERLAIPVNAIYGNYQQYGGLIVFLAAAGYGMQVYVDFAGGIAIARGVAQMLGIELAENFRQPYFSRSIEDFWRRWHITLGQWMRSYVFYPLSLSKWFAALGRSSRRLLGGFAGKRVPSLLAMFVVYALVGLWHGPDLKYLVYGLWNGLFIMAGILLPEAYARMRTTAHVREEGALWKGFQMLRTFVICSVGRLFSRGESLSAALHMMGSLVTGGLDLSFLRDGTLLSLGLDAPNWVLLVLLVGLVLAVDALHERGVRIRASLDRQPVVVRWALYYAAILAVIIFGAYGTGLKAGSFIYERF